MYTSPESETGEMCPNSEASCLTRRVTDRLDRGLRRRLRAPPARSDSCDGEPAGCTDVDARPALFESRQEAVPTETLPPATILVVDDEPVVSRLVSRYLTHIGYQVVEASSGELALGVVRRRRPPIDAVLSDIVMPGMDGLELAAAVLAASPGPSVLLMTGQLPEGVERIEVGRRIVQVVRKPLNLDGLRELLQVILDGYPPDAPAEPASYAGS